MRPTFLILASATTSLHAEVAFEKQMLTQEFVAEGCAVADFNKDGHADVAAGPYLWLGPKFEKRVAFASPRDTPLKPESEYSNWFVMAAADVTGDGWPDVISVDFPGKETWLFENPGKTEAPWKRRPLLDSTDNESPAMLDISGDGKPDILCLHRGSPGYAEIAWSKPDQAATFQAIAPADGNRYQRFTHGYGGGDINGDKRADILVKDGWYEHPKEAGQPWTFHSANFSPLDGHGGAQMLVFDINGDGRNDVITSYNSHGYGIGWFENQPDGTFREHRILGKTAAESASGVTFSQPHALAAADLNGDGVIDFVSGKRRWAHGNHGDPEPNADPVLYWFETKRDGKGGTEIIPHEIDRASGVGTQFEITDINGDKKPDIVIANKSGVFVFRQR